MKKLLKYIIPILIFLVITTSANAEWWAKNASQSLVTNDGSGFANADIHVRNCYLGLGTTPCGSAGGGSVTNFSFTDGSGFDGTVTNPTTTPNLSLTTTLASGRLPFITTGGALTSNSLLTINNSGSIPELKIGSAGSVGRIIEVNNTLTGQTTNKFGIFSRDTGTYDTTAGIITSYAGYIENTSSRSTGANAKNNVGLYVNATGGQNNYALIVGSGNIGIGTGTPTSVVDYTSNGLGTTPSSTQSISLNNLTPAVPSGQQISPALRWVGQGWKTTATAGSQPVEWRTWVLPIQGTTNPSSQLVFERSFSGGGFSQMISFGSEGQLVAQGQAGTAGQVLTSNGATSGIGWTTPSTFTLADGSGTTANGFGVDWRGTLTSDANIAMAGQVINLGQDRVTSLFMDGNDAVSIGDVFGNDSANTLVISNTGNNYLNNASDTSRLAIATTSPNSTLQVNGSLSLPLTAPTTDYVILSTDYTISANNGIANVNITLPDASTCQGRIYVIKRRDNSSTGRVEIISDGGSPVQNPETGALGMNYDLQDWGSNNPFYSVMYHSNGSSWEAIK